MAVNNLANSCIGDQLGDIAHCDFVIATQLLQSVVQHRCAIWTR